MSVVDELERLKGLRDSGVLSDAEFEAAKSEILAGTPPPTPPTPDKDEDSSESSGGGGCGAAGCGAIGTVVGLLVLGGLVTIFALIVIGQTRVDKGVHGVDELVAAAIGGPVQLVDAVENLPASSWKAIPFTLEYDGVLRVEVQVLRGNDLEISVVPPASIEAKKSGGEIRHYPNFHAPAARELRQSHPMSRGTYYLLLEDDTLGLLSASASDVDVEIWLDP